MTAGTLPLTVFSSPTDYVRVSVTNISIRLMYALLPTRTGDPWRDATLSSDFHSRQSTTEQPIGLGDGFHCSDLITSSGTVDPTILAVQQKALAEMQTWLKTWKPSAKHSRRDDITNAPGEPLVKPVNAWLRGVATVVA